jgi:hypothetical protein
MGRLGAERHTRMIPAVVFHQDETGRLWFGWHPIPRRRWYAVEVDNATAERDGTRQRSFLRVPPETRTAREGVAWTYGLTAREYEVAAKT